MRIFISILLVSCVANAQEAGVRSLDRNAQDGVSPVLDDRAVAPLFDSGAPSRVADRVASGELQESQDELGVWLQSYPLHPHTAEARFLLGYVAHLNRDDARAIEALRASASEVPLLADHANYFAAQSAFRIERFDEASVFAALVPEASFYGPRSQFLEGRAQLGAGRAEAAVAALRGFVEEHPDARYIADVELALAHALLANGEQSAGAVLLARVSVRYPGTDAEEAAREALETLRPELSSELRERLSRTSDNDIVARASALFSRHRSETVIALLDDHIGSLERDSALWCQANNLIGRSYTKLRQHANAIPYYEAIVSAACENEDLVVKALYNAGRASWNIELDDQAMDYFRRLYNGYSGHTYADDAMLYEARIERSNGNAARALEVLEEQLRRFPEGDMLGDANWLLFENELGAGNYEAAIAFADAIAERTGENGLYNHGRIAYFRATALQETGDTLSAMEGYATVAREAPLSYYALLALNRLDSLDPSRTETLIGELRLTVATAEPESVEIRPLELIENDTFQRGILLLKLGLMNLARHQFDELVDRYPNDDGLLWIVTFLFDRAGAFHISHNIPRRRIASFLTSYPDSSTWDQWLLAYPTPFLVEVNEAAEERSLDPFLIYAIMREESGFNPRAESFANARGLMQLMLPTARDMARRAGVPEPSARHLFRPATSIALGSEYLLLLSERYGQHPALTIAGYNGGQGNVDRWLRDLGELPLDRFIEEIPYRQTRDYAKRVLMTYWIYRWLYAETPVVSLSFDLPGTGG